MTHTPNQTRSEAQGGTTMTTQTQAYTPGPWRSTDIVDSASGLLIATQPTDYDPIAVAIGSGREANARLIAAAPELLEALAACEDALRMTQEMLADHDVREGQATFTRIREAARHIIQKAHGE